MNAPNPALRLELLGISKQYPAVKANDRVSLAVAPGQIEEGTRRLAEAIREAGRHAEQPAREPDMAVPLV
jgi:hypothetical protein